MRKLTGFFFLFFSVITLAQESLFTLLDNSKTGIDFSNDLVDTKQHSIFLYANYYGGAGVGIGDFDNDGLDDIFFAANLLDDKIFRNLGNFQFEDKTEKSGIINNGSWSTGVLGLTPISEFASSQTSHGCFPTASIASRVGGCGGG